MRQPTVPQLRATAAIALLSVALAGCSLFSSGPGATSSPTARSNAGTSTSTATATPTPTPVPLVKSVTLVATIGEPKDWTPAGLTWKGIQTATASIGARASLVVPSSPADIETDLEQAAQTEGAVVVTVGQESDAAVQQAATAHPATQFLEMNVAVAAGSPSNVHGVAFDEAEAGYLAGYVAASFAGSGGVGMVGDTKTDTRSANYAAGFRSGASQASAGIALTIGYAGSPDLPDKGRAASAALVKAGDTVILAMPSLAGIGAMRDACARKAQLVAVDTDAWQTVPDVQPCLIVSVLNRYDTAVGAAILAINSSKPLQRVLVDDLASGGIALSEFHADLPPGFQGQLDAVIGALKNGPPRPASTPPNPEPPASAGPGASAVPSSV